jgi:hypothetical protein
MNKPLLSRRDFAGLCVALGSSFFSVGTMTVGLSSASARAVTPMVKFPDGTIVPALGRALQISRRGDIRKPLRKKRCAPAFRSG